MIRSRKVYFFPKYSSKAPSSRYRVYNYLKFYNSHGLKFQVKPLFGDWYLENIWSNEPRYKVFHKIVWVYFLRMFWIIFLPKNAIVYIGAELFPYFPPIFEYYLKLRKIKYLIEFDDAIFHNYDQNRNLIIRSLFKNKTKKVISNAECIITGSEYLTDYAIKYNKKIYQIPTSIDFDKYRYGDNLIENQNEFIIGWIGSSSQSFQILYLIPVFRELISICKFKIHLVGFDQRLAIHLNGLPVEIIKWTESSEVEEMLKFSVGIMPLDNSLFSRGKCAFKLVQYMACGIPTISSPLKSNININKYSKNLFADSLSEWKNSIVEIYNNQEKFKKIGKINKEIAELNYTIQVNHKKYLEILEKI